MIKGGYGKKDPPLGLKRSKYTLDPVGLTEASSILPQVIDRSYDPTWYIFIYPYIALEKKENILPRRKLKRLVHDM